MPSIEIKSSELEVVIHPEKGGDISALIDRASGINVLFTTPWRPRDTSDSSLSFDSKQNWMSAYEGGWQQLIPNAGEERIQAGARQGYHGEAALRSWTVTARTENSLTMTVDLMTAPLRLVRKVEIDGDSLHVDSTVTNLSQSPIGFRWVEHPAFGPPFLDADAYIQTDAKVLITDADIPGSALPRNAVIHDPFAVTAIENIARFPTSGGHRSAFAALANFQSAEVRFHSPNAGFGMALKWDAAVFPFAWVWQEFNESDGYPWFRRAYVAAVEPANVLPGKGYCGEYQRGEDPILAGLATVTTRISMSRVHLPPSR